MPQILETIGPRAGTAPLTVTLTELGTVALESVFAHYNGAAASGDWRPTLTIKAQNGAILARVFPSQSLATGDTADVTFAPFLNEGGVGGRIDSTENVGDTFGVHSEESTGTAETAGYVLTADGSNGSTWAPAGGGGLDYNSLVLSQPTLQHFWPCQDASGGAVDTIGNIPMIEQGTPTYQLPGPFAGTFSIEVTGNTSYLKKSGVAADDMDYIGNNSASFTIAGWWQVFGTEDLHGVNFFGRGADVTIDAITFRMGRRLTNTYAARTATFITGGSPLVGTGQWTHFAYTFDSSGAGSSKLYVGGILNGTVAAGSGGNGAMGLGMSTVANTNRLYGVAVYTSVLTAAQILAQAQSGTITGQGSITVMTAGGNFTFPADLDNVLLLVTAAATITLPAANSTAGRLYSVKRTGGGAVTVTGAGTDPIDGAGAPGTVALALNDSVRLVSDGAGWQIISDYP